MIQELRIVPQNDGSYEFRVYYSSLAGEEPTRQQLLDEARYHLQNVDISLAGGDEQKATLIRTPTRMHLLVERPAEQGVWESSKGWWCLG